MKLVDRLRQQCRKRSENQINIDMPVLGLAGRHIRQKWSWNSRYVTKASLCHITMERQCLRWWMTARPCIHPLLWLTNWHETRVWKRSNHTCWKIGKRKTDAQPLQQVEVLHYISSDVSHTDFLDLTNGHTEVTEVGKHQAWTNSQMIMYQ